MGEQRDHQKLDIKELIIQSVALMDIEIATDIVIMRKHLVKYCNFHERGHEYEIIGN